MTAKNIKKITFDDRLLIVVQSLTERGMTNKEIAEILGIHENTLRNYAKENDDLRMALTDGKEFSDQIVERALFAKATGIQYTEQVASKDRNGKVTIKKVKKYQPPDTSAIQFWLRCRQPDQWREKHHIEHEVGKSLHAMVVDALVARRKELPDKIDEPELVDDELEDGH